MKPSEVKQMELLTKEDLLFKRNEKEELIPKKIEIKSLKKFIKITPIVYGEFQEYQFQMDRETGLMPAKLAISVIKKHLIEPVLTDKDMESLSSTMGNLILLEIMKYSSIVSTKIDSEKDDIKN